MLYPSRLCWYAAIDFCQQLRDSTSWRKRPDQKHREETNLTVLNGFLVLSRFLIRETKVMENPEVDDKQRKAIHGRIPSDMTQDPAALARELRWRCERALGEDSEDESDLVRPSVAVEKPKATRRRKQDDYLNESLTEDKRLIVFGRPTKKKNAKLE
jgi:hypothetical protein